MKNIYYFSLPFSAYRFFNRVEKMAIGKTMYNLG